MDESSEPDQPIGSVEFKITSSLRDVSSETIIVIQFAAMFDRCLERNAISRPCNAKSVVLS